MLGFWLSMLANVVISVLPVRTEITWTYRSWQATLDLQVTIAWIIKLRRSIDVTHNVGIALEHMLKRWRATGEPVKVPLQKTVRRFPGRRVWRAARKPIRFFRRWVAIRTLDIHAEIGGYDAMQSALLAGLSWSVTGTALSQVSRLFRLDPATPKVNIVPVFGGPACRLKVHCIVTYPLGNAIFVGMWLFFRLIRDREVRAWARDSWRRKGVEGSGRASDPGPDEDGHGEPERHG